MGVQCACVACFDLKATHVLRVLVPRRSSGWFACTVRRCTPDVSRAAQLRSAACTTNNAPTVCRGGKCLTLRAAVLASKPEPHPLHCISQHPLTSRATCACCPTGMAST